MTKFEIVEQIAKERRVEEIVENITHSSSNPALKDLCQLVYLILLDYDEEKIIDLWENNQMSFFLAKVISRQYRSPRSKYYYLYRRFSAKSEPLDE